jgi:hypothetical protein
MPSGRTVMGNLLPTHVVSLLFIILAVTTSSAKREHMFNGGE